MSDNFFWFSFADDHFRSRFLHGRDGMLKSCAKKMLELADPTGLVWVDLGGGTAENVKTMSKYIDLSKFEKIYVVDICGPLCDVAKKKATALGWNNVEIVEADVCEFEPERKPATLITFSYSLSSKFIFSFTTITIFTALTIRKFSSYLYAYCGFSFMQYKNVFLRIVVTLL